MRIALLLLLFFFAQTGIYAQDKEKDKEKPTPTIADKTENMQAYPGYFPFYWSEKEGKLYLEVDKWDTEFLYVNSLSGGLGSNDIGLDRNQLGDSRIVKFHKIGPKVVLVQPNYDYRANSDNADERQSVADAFAQSVLAGFTVVALTGERALIDLTPFLLEDSHGVVQRLKQRKEGTYKVDASRSYLYLERTKNFPKNSEFEAVLTLAGEATGRQVRSVTPNSDAISLRTHHSFVELPDDGYTPRMYDPRSGYYPLSYADYATPIFEPLVKRFITRHRLQKKDPNAAVSEAVEPIVYYLDRGAPEPIRSALLEGASWWNEAFEAAGYRNAFQVKLLPEDADPLDVRYNVINWVHRSTRGWSYGSSVTDPRTGEIIKGHVLLGSLRVRQDFLIAQGLIQAYADGTMPDPRLEAMALARLRQLSAHEVGHTLGLAHNFAASTNERASVMDYPHPYFSLDNNGNIDFSQAYATGIGEWDKRTILYGYEDFSSGTNEAQSLTTILQANIQLGLDYLSDQDARPAGSASPIAHLWDSGQSATDELRRLGILRRKAMLNFGEANIPVGAPMATLENVFVPIYLMHRYQVEAVSKLIGGVNYSYSVRGDGSPGVSPVSRVLQEQALAALLETLKPDFLRVPDQVRQLIPPQPLGYSRDRELFNLQTGLTFDPLGMAEASADYTLTFLLQPERLARLLVPPAAGEAAAGLSPGGILLRVSKEAAEQVEQSRTAYDRSLAYMVEKRLQQHLLQLAGNEKISQEVSAAAWGQLATMEEQVGIRLRNASANADLRAHLIYLREQLEAFRLDPAAYKSPAAPDLPDGSPIGCGE